MPTFLTRPRSSCGIGNSRLRSGFVDMNKKSKRGPGQPRKEPTKLVRAYAADVRKLKSHGKTQAEAIRKLLLAQS